METEKEKAAIEKRHFLMFLIEKRLALQTAMKSSNSSKTCEEKMVFFPNLIFSHRQCIIFIPKVL
jgi:hypothetical protein